MKESKNYFRIFILIFCLSLFMGLFSLGRSSAQTGANTYYVDKFSKGGTCNDTYAGTSISQPWCTLNHANRTVTAGSTVLIREGIYEGSEAEGQYIHPFNSGSASGFITYASYNNEPVTIRTGVYGAGILIDGKSYIKIQNLNIQNVTYWATIRNSSNIIIQNNIMTDAKGWGCLSLQNTDFSKILNNNMTRCGNPITNESDGIEIYANSDDNQIEGNTISYGGHSLIYIYGARTDSAIYTADRNVVRNNVLSNPWATNLGIGLNAHDTLVEGNKLMNGTQESTYVSPRPGIQLSGYNATIKNNLIYNNTGWGIMCMSYLFDGGGAIGKNQMQYCAGNKIFNNTIYSNGDNAILIKQREIPGVSKDNEVYNNIFYKNELGSDQYDKPGANNHSQVELDEYYNQAPWGAEVNTNGNVFHHNLMMYDNVAEQTFTKIRPGGSAPAPGYSAIGGWVYWTLAQAEAQLKATYSDGTNVVPAAWNNVAADPLFVDPDGADNVLGNLDDNFHLQAGSPACARGVGGGDLGAFPCGTTQNSLVVSKTVDKTTAKAGDVLTYTINYSVIANITNLVISDQIPLNSTYVSGSASGGITPINNILRWNLGSLAAGSTGIVTFKVNVQ